MTGIEREARSAQTVHQLDVLDKPSKHRRPGLISRQSALSRSQQNVPGVKESPKSRSDDGDQSHRRAWPDQNIHRFSWLSFAWVTPLLRLGHQRPLGLDDIWHINSQKSSERLSQRVSAVFARRVSASQSSPLRAALLDVFKDELLVGGVAQLLSTFIHALTPFALRFLIAFATSVHNGEHQPLSHGIGTVLAITAMQLMQSLCTNHSLHYSMLVGAQTRSALTALILHKSMKLSPRARAGRLKALFQNAEGWPNGKITNLMSTDTSRIDQACSVLHPVWTAPVSIVMSLVLLYFNLSYGAFCGFLVLAAAGPLVSRAMKLALSRRSSINNIADSRATLAQELLQGIKFIKIAGWESAFVKRHQELRKKEVQTLRTLIDLRNTVMSASMAIPVFAAAPSFALYSYLAENVTPARVFSSIGLLNSLRQPLGVIPVGISQLLDASISISRIESFLLAEEAEDTAHFDADADSAVELSSASFTWESHGHSPQDGPTDTEKQEPKLRVPFERSSSLESQQFSRPLLQASSRSDKADGIFQLSELSLTLKRRELIAVVGDVGSGKSSLLAALAGQMRMTTGSVTYGGTKAYCAEDAWIQNASIKDNILFGQTYESDWYNQVIDACALKDDLESFTSGDLTEVGERGVTLSGGQKQRINIARSIYSGANIILMDDPLSAVDAHVGQHIFDVAILGLLREKCRVIATHQTHVLPSCDRIVRLDQGRIVSIEKADQATKLNVRRQLSFGSKEKARPMSQEKLDEISKDHAHTTPASSLMAHEERPTRGGVPMSVYSFYVKSTGHAFSVVMVLGLLALLQGSIIGGSLWLSCWTSYVYELSDTYYLGIYATFGVVQAGLMFLFSKSITYFATRASYNMLIDALAAVVKSPMSFFDTTPLGRLINRFSKDTDTIDNTLADAIRLFMMTAGSTIAVFILILSYYPLFAFAILPVLAAYLSYTSYYRSSAREMKFHESMLRSKVFAQFGEAINGVPTIKSYGAQDWFVSRLYRAIDDMSSAYILSFAYQRWLAVRLDAIGLVLVLTAGLLAVRSSLSVDPSVIGIVVAWIVSVAQMLQFTIRYLTDVDRDMVSVERLQHYATRLLKEEPDNKTWVQVPASWPARGKIVFEMAHLQYREDLPDALRSFNLHIRPGERIGVVGRTGAGKSTILTALLRLVNLRQGRIVIDGVDISQIALADLRSRITVVTQDPKLFRGTIRSNLDPFEEHPDSELLRAMQRVHLQAKDPQKTTQPSGLDLTSAVEEDGANFSFGQRQLLVLARALVRHTPITVFDEATTAIDLETDRNIQQTIAKAFNGRTLICIAHRLRTILSFDRICVMDAGTIAELGAPQDLWRRGGLFRRLCDQSGILEQDFA